MDAIGLRSGERPLVDPVDEELALGEHRRYLLAGSPITFHDVASQLSHVLNRTIRYQSVPVEDFTRGLAATMPAELVDVLASEWRLAAAGGLSIFSDHVELITGTKPRTFRHFVEDHATLFA